MHENFIALATPEGQSKQLVILMEAEVDVLQDNPFDFILQAHATALPFRYTSVESDALSPYLRPDNGPAGLAVQRWVESQFPGGLRGDTVDSLTRLNTAVHRLLRYTRREETGVQSPEVTLETQSGSCRDFAVLLIEACRANGLAARFVSGYLHTAGGESPGRAENAMHAWAEVYLPGAGWKGVDPTNGIFCSGDFIPVAVALDPSSVSPIQGSYVSPHPVDNELHATVDVVKQS
jgi:transglutaminase-like putative cysteine protease